MAGSDAINIEIAFRAGQIGQAERDAMLREYQMQSDYLPIRWAQTWGKMVEKAWGDLYEQSTTKPLHEAVFWNSWTVLQAAYSPLTAAAKELGISTGEFALYLGVPPKGAAFIEGATELAGVLIPPGAWVKGAGGMAQALSTKQATQIVKIAKDAATGTIKVINNLSPTARAKVVQETVSKHLGRELKDIGELPRSIYEMRAERAAAEILFDQLISKQGQQAVARVAATQSAELQKILAEGEKLAKVKAVAPKPTVVAVESAEEAARFEQLLKEPPPVGLSLAERTKYLRDQEMAKYVAKQAEAISEAEFAQFARETGISKAELQTRAMREEIDIRNLIDSINAQLKSRLGTEKTLEKAAETVRGKPEVLSETERTLEAARATMLGKTIPEQLLNDMENMRKVLKSKGCL